MRLTVDIPDRLAEQLHPFRERLPEILQRGLQDLLSEGDVPVGDEGEIIAVLASQPSPERVIALRPSPELQARASQLLAASKAGTLDAKGEIELERYLTLEHLVRLAKAHAFARLQASS